MLKKILSYGGIEAATKGLNKLQFLILPFLLTTQDYGKIGLLMSIELLLPIFTLLGFERSILRFYGNNDNIESFAATIFASIKVSHVVVFLLLICLYLFGVSEVFGLLLVPDLLILVILVYFQAYNSIILLIYRVEGNHKLYFRSKLLLQLSRFLLILVAVFILNSYSGYLVGATLVAFVINIIFKKKIEPGDKFSKKTFKYLFVFSWPFIFHGLAMNLLGNADKFIIQKFLTFSEVGQYTFIYSFGSMILFAFVGISVYMEPLIYKSKTNEQRDKIIDRYVVYALSAGIIFYSIIEFMSITVIPALYGNKYESVIPYISYLSMAYLLYPFYLASNYKMIYDKKTKAIAITSIISCIMGLGLNMLAIPKYGLFGAIIVNFISYTAQILFFLFIANNMTFVAKIAQILIMSLMVFMIIIFRLPSYLAIPIMGLYLVYFGFSKKYYSLKMEDGGH